MTDIIAFYVIRNAAGKYYESRHFNSTLETTRAHFEREESAKKQLRELQGNGHDVEGAVIVPVALKALDPIQPELLQQKSGFVIEISKPSTKWKDGKSIRFTKVSYWKGNKKAKLDFSHPVSAVCSFDGRPQTLTASIFSTKSEARAKLDEMMLEIHKFSDLAPTCSPDYREYVEKLEQLKFKVVPV